MQRSILDLITALHAGDPFTQAEIDRLLRHTKAPHVGYLAAVHELYPEVFEDLRRMAPTIVEAGPRGYTLAKRWARRHHLACEDEPYRTDEAEAEGKWYLLVPWWTALWAVEAARDLVRPAHREQFLKAVVDDAARAVEAARRRLVHADDLRVSADSRVNFHSQRPRPDLKRPWLYPQFDKKGGLIAFGDPTPRRKNVDHFNWLAHRQVGGESFHEIAKNDPARRRGADPEWEEPHWTTVSKAVIKLAKRLHLKLRPSDPGGRPQRAGR